MCSLLAAVALEVPTEVVLAKAVVVAAVVFVPSQIFTWHLDQLLLLLVLEVQAAQVVTIQLMVIVHK